MQIVGIDVSLTNTGVAVISPEYVGLYRISSKPCPDDVKPRWERFDGMVSHLPAVSSDDLVMIEQPAFSRTTGKHHDRSGLWWLMVDYALSSGAKVVEVTPSGLKKYVTGKGTAGKEEVMAAMIRRMMPVDPDLIITDNNEADALALACMGARHLGSPIDGDLPKVNLSAMDAVKWASC